MAYVLGSWGGDLFANESGLTPHLERAKVFASAEEANTWLRTVLPYHTEMHLHEIKLELAR